MCDGIIHFGSEGGFLYDASLTLNQKIYKQIPRQLKSEQMLDRCICPAEWRMHGQVSQGLKEERVERDLVKTGKVQLELHVCLCVPVRLRISVCGIFLPRSFTAKGSLLSLAGRSLIAINFLISSAFPIMDNNRKAVIGF